LTKPDRIPPTEEEIWLPFIRGEREDTSWFCVKCPNSQAINEGITWEDARAAESTFFSSSLSWSTLEDTFRQKLGTENLTTCLSNKLCDLIADRFVYILTITNQLPLQMHRLPDIQRDLSQLLEKTNRELAELPQPPSAAPMGEILRLITDFTRDVRKQGEGEPVRDGLLQQIRPWQEAFRLAIRKTAPCFVPRFKKNFVQPINSSAPELSMPSAREFSAPALDDLWEAPSAPEPLLSAPSVPGLGMFAASAPRLSSLRSASIVVSESPVPSTFTSSPPSETILSDHAAPVDTVRPMRVKSKKKKESVESFEGPWFLEGEEHHHHIGLDDGEEIFIDDVLETAEWCVISGWISSYF
jgi:Dynamin central region